MMSASSSASLVWCRIDEIYPSLPLQNWLKGAELLIVDLLFLAQFFSQCSLQILRLIDQGGDVSAVIPSNSHMTSCMFMPSQESNLNHDSMSCHHVTLYHTVNVFSIQKKKNAGISLWFSHLQNVSWESPYSRSSMEWWLTLKLWNRLHMTSYIEIPLHKLELTSVAAWNW